MSTLDNNLFEQIIVPAQAPSAWPPATIYWLILAAIIVLGVLTLVLIKGYIKRQKIVKQALLSLQQLQQQDASFAQLNQLLKGLCLHYYSRQQVASITGQAWFMFLQEHHAQQDMTLFENQDEFCLRLYQQNSTCSEKDFESAKKWIQAFPKQVKARQKLALNNKQLAGKKHV